MTGARAVGIRPAGPADAERIHAMLKALARDLGSEGRVTSRAGDFGPYLAGPDPAIHALIAERGGQAVGLCLYLMSFSSWRGERGVYVQDIWVDAAERGSGLAARLIAETARRAAGAGARFLRLSVDRENQPARAFYARIGLGYAAHECIYLATGPAFDALTRIDRNETEEPT